MSNTEYNAGLNEDLPGSVGNLTPPVYNGSSYYESPAGYQDHQTLTFPQHSHQSITATSFPDMSLPPPGGLNSHYDSISTDHNVIPTSIVLRPPPSVVTSSLRGSNAGIYFSPPNVSVLPPARSNEMQYTNFDFHTVDPNVIPSNIVINPPSSIFPRPLPVSNTGNYLHPSALTPNIIPKTNTTQHTPQVSAPSLTNPPTYESFDMLPSISPSSSEMQEAFRFSVPPPNMSLPPHYVSMAENLSGSFGAGSGLPDKRPAVIATQLSTSTSSVVPYQETIEDESNYAMEIMTDQGNPVDAVEFNHDRFVVSSNLTIITPCNEIKASEPTEVNSVKKRALLPTPLKPPVHQSKNMCGLQTVTSSGIMYPSFKREISPEIPQRRMKSSSASMKKILQNNLEHSKNYKTTNRMTDKTKKASSLTIASSLNKYDSSKSCNANRNVHNLSNFQSDESALISSSRSQANSWNPDPHISSSHLNRSNVHNQSPIECYNSNVPQKKRRVLLPTPILEHDKPVIKNQPCHDKSSDREPRSHSPIVHGSHDSVSIDYEYGDYNNPRYSRSNQNQPSNHSHQPPFINTANSNSVTSSHSSGKIFDHYNEELDTHAVPFASIHRGMHKEPHLCQPSKYSAGLTRAPEPAVADSEEEENESIYSWTRSSPADLYYKRNIKYDFKVINSQFGTSGIRIESVFKVL